jgi:hypothetical protein
MRKLLIAMSALTLLAGCTAQASIPAAKKAALQTQFNFPKASCGDKPTGGNDTWYPVFVDRGSLETIRHNFCADAVSTVRKDSQVQAVQVASFTNRDKAIEFAKAVGGDVGQPTNVASSSRQPQATSVGSNEAILIANEPDSRISLRGTPSATGKDLGYGLVGDHVSVINQTTVEGYTWYQVRFPRSGAVGWIHGNFVSVVSASQGSLGLGISRSAVQSRFEAAGFYFKDSPLNDGRSRTEGQNGTSSIELIGSPDNLEEATIVIFPSTNQSENEINAIYTLALADIVCPNWTDKDDWLANNTKQEGGEASTVQNGQLITLTVSKPLGVPVVFLSIKPAQH